MTHDGAAQRPPRRARPALREPSGHQLRLFLVLAEELHFGRAARRLFVTQPTLSQQIRALEERLGVDLLERSSRRVDLTPAGQALVPEARELLTAMNRVRELAASFARQANGHLRIGAIGGEAAMPYTVAILAELAAQESGVTVEIRAVGFADQVEALTRGELDDAFLRPPLPPVLRSIHLATEPSVACLPVDDPLVRQAPLTLAQLRDHLVVDVPPQARAWWDHWTVNPRPDGRPVRFGPPVADIEAMLLAVARGQAIAFLPAAAGQLYPRPGIAYVGVTDLPVCTAALAWLPDRRDQPALAALIRAARTVTGRGDATRRYVPTASG
ncbi:LysR family transcriptional regulator [Micromonospora sp. NPDC050397]|uniref:LysR family transcriptional regulator n=1 Tax=Micromonospora sp. NPDC050397 TaxID=3364279 RepID=UPI00384F757F